MMSSSGTPDSQTPDTATPGSETRPLRIAVIGSGPSGFYAVASLLKKEGLHAEIDIFDRLPTPFGLVRGGVAPDHQKIKNVIRVYDKTASHDKVRFFGNVQIGRDISVDELKSFYDQIVFAVGNESDRRMGLPGEELEGVHSATEFVGWYNGHPDFQDREFDLENARRVAVVGNGNVAMDVSRILVRDPDALATTDITDEAVAALRKSKIEEIVLLGRRGPAQAAFSPKEIKEIGELDEVDLVVSEQDSTLDETSAAWLETQPPSARKNVEYLKECTGREATAGKRKVLCRFLVSPVEFKGEDGRVRQIVIEHNALSADKRGTPRPSGTGVTETLDVDLVFKAIGYRGTALPGVPFHDAWGIFPNTEGRITETHEGDVVPGMYVVGWAKRGPSGLIGTNGPDSDATVVKMIEDLEAGKVPAAKNPDGEAIVTWLKDRGIDYVTFEDWQRLNDDEVALGEAKGKVRDKYTSIDHMMAAVRRLRA